MDRSEPQQAAGRTARPTDDASRASGASLALLAALTIVSPWPFGGVHPGAVRALSLLGLSATALALLAQARRGARLGAVPKAPAAALIALGLVQLLPLPALLHRVLAPGSQRVWHPTGAAAAAVLGGGQGSISVDPDATRIALGLLAGLMGLALAAAPALARKEAALPAVLAVLAGALALGVYAVLARGAYGPLLYGRIAVPTVSPFGPFVSKNHFAGYQEMASLLAAGLAFGLMDRENRGGTALGWTSSPRAGRVVLAWAAAAALALSVLVSLSRGGAVSLGCGLLALVALRVFARRHGRELSSRRLALAGAALAALVPLFALTLPREARERLAGVAGAGREASGSFRLAVWRAGLSMTLASPLAGQGLGAFADGFPRYKRGHGELRVEHAENDYVELSAEGGLLGIGAALALAGLAFRGILAGLRRQADRLLRGLGLGALGGIAALLVHSALDFNLRIPSNALLFAFLLALALGASGRVASAPRAAALGLAGVAVFLIALVARTPLQPAPLPRSDLEAAAVTEPAARSLRLELAETRLSRILARRPAHAEAWVLLGWARAARGDASGRALAEHGAALDPQRQALRVTLPESSAAAAPGPAR
jgi:O-antigen ligase